MRQTITVIRKDFLIPGTGVGIAYSNTPPVRVSLITSFNWYSNDAAGYTGQNYIIFNEAIKWYYKSKDEMEADFARITKLLIPEDEDRNGVFE